MLKVSRQPNGEPEIFHSLQGEGPTMGTPAVFLRLATCNLACAWCDTRYTWDWRSYNYHQEVVEMPVEQAEQQILCFECPHLVITGGEPLLQQSELLSLISSLNRQGFYCEVETNGTIAPQKEVARHIHQWNVSPKLSNSCNAMRRREVPHVLDAFRRLPSAYFKFVVVAPQDVDEVCALADKHRLPRERIILMPEGTTPEVLQERSRWLAQACAQHGFRFSTRLHILLWRDQRGR